LINLVERRTGGAEAHDVFGSRVGGFDCFVGARPGHLLVADEVGALGVSNAVVKATYMYLGGDFSSFVLLLWSYIPGPGTPTRSLSRYSVPAISSITYLLALFQSSMLDAT
jgi:hypothetical protein